MLSIVCYEATEQMKYLHGLPAMAECEGGDTEQIRNSLIG
jgi:hypothetical protein